MTGLRIKRAFMRGFAITAISISGAMSAQAETLTDALISAYNNSGLLDQNRALLRAADEDVAQAVGSLRPVLNYILNTNYSSTAANVPGSDGISSGLSLSMSFLIYDFGRSQLSIDLAKENVLVLRDALVGIEQDVLLRAARAYMSVQRDTSLVELSDSNIRLIQQELKAAQDRFEVGEITRTDVAIAEARLAAATSEAAVSAGNLAVSKEEYRAAVGYYPGVLSDPPEPPKAASSQASATNTARQLHPQILQAKRSVTVAELGVALARSALLPTFSGNAAIGLDEYGDDDQIIGLSLGGPIYQGGQLASRIRQGAAYVDSSRAGLHLAHIFVDQNVGIAWTTLQVSDAALISSVEQIRAATIAFEGTREEAKLGARTTLDVLDEQQELLDAYSVNVTAKTTRYSAIYNLLASMGLLTVEHLGLGIATYDPTAYYNAVKSAPTHLVSPQGEKLDHVLKALGKN